MSFWAGLQVTTTSSVLHLHNSEAIHGRSRPLRIRSGPRPGRRALRCVGLLGHQNMLSLLMRRALSRPAARAAAPARCPRLPGERDLGARLTARADPHLS